jgi:TPR repeat protein
MKALRPRAALIAGLSIALSATAALAQEQTRPPPTPELEAALNKADAGDPAPLTKLADAGNVDAEYYAAIMYIFGRGTIPKNGVKGCAYAGKASDARPEAMHLVGLCYQNGLSGAKDTAKAEAAYLNAANKGFVKSKCALGGMLMNEPGQAQRGMDYCKQAAQAGDIDAQMTVADIYFSGGPVTADRTEARRWYEMAANQGNAQAARRLGEMYAKGDGGPRDTKKAMELWMAAEKAGDPLVAILVADQMFSDLTGGRTPGPGKYAFKGGVPVGDIEVIEDWYRQASSHDPRPEIKKRADYALKILASFKKAAQYEKTGR